MVDHVANLVLALIRNEGKRQMPDLNGKAFIITGATGASVGVGVGAAVTPGIPCVGS